MPRQPRERGVVAFYKVPLTIHVDGRLYASSASTTGGIAAALRRNMPTETQILFREQAGEEIKDLDELAKEVEASLPQLAEGEEMPSTVFRRDTDGRAFLHANYLKGHLRECAENTSRTLNFWGLHDFVTKTVRVKPDKLYLDGEIGTVTMPVTFTVRRKGGVEVRQSTQKTEEFVESPTLRWEVYLLADPRWDRNLMEQLLRYGSNVRGIGPGRGRCESYYAFELGEFEQVSSIPLGDAPR